MALKLNKTLYTLTDELNTKAPAESPALTGTPTAPTAVTGTNTTQIATTQFVGSAITASAGNLLRITSFTSSGTWTKQSDVSRIVVYCVGGGGGGASGGTGGGFGGTGGTTSFGVYSSASGGGGGAWSSGGSTITGPALGGSVGLGDLIIPGTPSGQGFYGSGTNYIGHFGTSCFANLGRGGLGGMRSTASQRTGGGGGATSIKLLTSTSVPESSSVIIGAGGAFGPGTIDFGTDGTSGIVIIYEYGA